jgi:hypothetical protein
MRLIQFDYLKIIGEIFNSQFSGLKSYYTELHGGNTELHIGHSICVRAKRKARPNRAGFS